MIKRLLAILMVSYFMLSTISVNAYANENRAAIELEIMELAKLYDVNVILEGNVAENVYFAPETWNFTLRLTS